MCHHTQPENRKLKPGGGRIQLSLMGSRACPPGFMKTLSLRITQSPRGPVKTALLAWKSQLLGACFFNDPELSIRTRPEKMKEELARGQRKERTLA